MDYKTDCEKKNKIKYSACTPPNLNLPFFTYGFFKPHQIAHSQIEDYMIKAKTKETFVKGYIRHVNGMPVLFLNKKSKYNVLGNIIYFKRRSRKKAYQTIGYSKHMNIYKWKEIEINGITVNALVSSTPRKLYKSKIWKSMQNDMELIIKDDYKYNRIHDYDWKLDPFYDETIKYIRDLLSVDDYNGRYGDLIKIQMLYTALWTALDRFLTFKYGDTKRGNVIALSKEDYFEVILRDILSRKNYRENPTVFSAQDLVYYELSMNNLEESALYYYTLRNNVVHIGKFVSEIRMLIEALLDLLEIFERVLKEVKRE